MGSGLPFGASGEPAPSSTPSHRPATLVAKMPRLGERGKSSWLCSVIGWPSAVVGLHDGRRRTLAGWLGVSPLRHAGPMDYDLAERHLADFVALLDEHERVHRLRYPAGYEGGDEWEAKLQELDDNVRTSLALIVAIVSNLEADLASEIAEHSEAWTHNWRRARAAAMHALGIVRKRIEIEAVLGPAGPQLSARSLHPVVWEAAARLWDDGHYKPAVHTAAVALEGHILGKANVDLSGTDLAVLFSLKPPDGKSPRLRFTQYDENTEVWRSEHEGAASMIRGAMQSIRNAASHAGRPDCDEVEGLERLAVLSYVARLIDRAVLVTV